MPDQFYVTPNGDIVRDPGGNAPDTRVIVPSVKINMTTEERAEIKARDVADPVRQALVAAELKEGNQSPVSGVGSALPVAVAPVTAIPLDGTKVFNADTVMSSTPLTIAAGQVEGGSCSFVIKGDGSSAWGGITGASKASGAVTFNNTLNAVNHALVWVDRGRVRYTISQSDPIEIASAPVAPTNTLPTIITAVAGSALVWTGGSAAGSPTPTTGFAWLTSADVLVQDNITSGSYTPPAAGSFKLRMTSTNSQGTDVDTLAVTVTAAATAPAAPTLSNATSITATGLTYTWADGTTGGSAITSRNADISFDGGSTWTAIATPTVGSNTITFASSESARAAQIRGRATNAVGAGSYGTLTGIAVPAGVTYTQPALPNKLKSEGGAAAVYTEAGDYTAGYVYTRNAIGVGYPQISALRTSSQGSFAWSLGANRLILLVHYAAAATIGAGDRTQLHVNTGVDQYVEIAATGLKVLDVSASALPADTGQSDTWVRGAGSLPSWVDGSHPLDLALSAMVSGGALRFYWWAGAAWSEIAVLRPAGGITGIGVQPYGNFSQEDAAYGSVGDTLQFGWSAT